MGEDPDLGLFLVFEYVEGETLHKRLKDGPLSVAEAATLVRELGDALAYAHGRGIVHRDVKPENVILSPAGSKLADFGIARLPDSTLTQGTGIVLGTPAYSAPEALRGAKFSPLSDQFSLAATLYEAISGKRAFPGDDALAVAARITNEEPPRIAVESQLDRGVDMALAKAMAKIPRARYAGTADYGTELSDALEGSAHRQKVTSELASARAQQATLPDHYHLQRRPRPGLDWTMAVSLTSVVGTWALMTFFDPASTAASHPPASGKIAIDVVEENPAPVAWLQQTPEEDDEDKDVAERPSPPRPKGSTTAAPRSSRAPVGGSKDSSVRTATADRP
jgi:serine/threonine-protein kinase